MVQTTMKGLIAAIISTNKQGGFLKAMANYEIELLNIKNSFANKWINQAVPIRYNLCDKIAGFFFLNLRFDISIIPLICTWAALALRKLNPNKEFDVVAAFLPNSMCISDILFIIR